MYVNKLLVETYIVAKKLKWDTRGELGAAGSIVRELGRTGDTKSMMC